MRPATRRRLGIFVRMVLASAIIGGVYGALVGLAYRGTMGIGLVVGIIQGATVSGIVGAFEIFAGNTRVGRSLEKAPFLVTVGVKALLYGAVIVLVVGGALGLRVIGVPPERPLADPFAPLSLVLSFALTFAFLFVLQVSRIVGGRTLRDVVLGRYRRPRTEERFFLFIDIAGSTMLAERIGAAAVHRFLGRVFQVAAGPIDDHRGEIYQYVGDEIVVTWTVARGREDGAALDCFFAVDRALASAAREFQRDFGAAPAVRGALHAGSVIAGEVGASKRAIVFHGDVMNTAARLEQASRDLGRRFVVSGDALARLPHRDGHGLEDLGLQPLRGREAPVHVFAAPPEPAT
jgi:adenylate cyclase